uniref:uncharacterized protein LOC120338378 isoform X1 n=1 Tax=Styela clava TaxID=7725 RepID=UPI00193A66DA|nr:uncharacterized protein LOC120338378 isoform X1 [Styela clava]
MHVVVDSILYILLVNYTILVTYHKYCILVYALGLFTHPFFYALTTVDPYSCNARMMYQLVTTGISPKVCSTRCAYCNDNLSFPACKKGKLFNIFCRAPNNCCRWNADIKEGNTNLLRSCSRCDESKNFTCTSDSGGKIINKMCKDEDKCNRGYPTSEEQILNISTYLPAIGVINCFTCSHSIPKGDYQNMTKTAECGWVDKNKILPCDLSTHSCIYDVTLKGIRAKYFRGCVPGKYTTNCTHEYFDNSTRQIIHCRRDHCNVLPVLKSGCSDYSGNLIIICISITYILSILYDMF